MNTSCNKFLEKQIAKGGKSAYVALLMLGALEKNEKDLLKRVNFSFVQSNLQNCNQAIHQNQAS